MEKEEEQKRVTVIEGILKAGYSKRQLAALILATKTYPGETEGKGYTYIRTAICCDTYAYGNRSTEEIKIKGIDLNSEVEESKITRMNFKMDSGVDAIVKQYYRNGEKRISVAQVRDEDYEQLIKKGTSEYIGKIEADFMIDADKQNIFPMNEKAYDFTIKNTDINLLERISTILTTNTTESVKNIFNNQKKIMETEEKKEQKAAEEQTAQKKEVYGSVYVTKTATNKKGEKYELKTPILQIQFNMEKVEQMEPDKNGNIHFSVHERNDAEKLEQGRKPTHYIIENTYRKDKQIDLYSHKDITVSKEDIVKLKKEQKVGENTYQKAFVTVMPNGDLTPTYGKYDENTLKAEIKGHGTEVNRVDRQIKNFNEITKGEEINLSTVGTAWKFNDKDGGEFYGIILDNDKLKFVPVDDNGMLHLNIHSIKEAKGGSAPTHFITLDTEFLNGRLDVYSVVDFQVKKADILNKKVNIEMVKNTNGQESVTHSTFINITSDNRVVLSKNKYPDLVNEEGKLMYRLNDATAATVDTKARWEEVQKRIEAAKKRQQTKESKQEVKQEVKKQAKNESPAAKRSKGRKV